MIKITNREDLKNGDRVFVIDKHPYSCSRAVNGLIGYVANLQDSDMLLIDVREEPERAKYPNVWLDGVFETSRVEPVFLSSFVFITDLNLEEARAEFQKLDSEVM